MINNLLEMMKKAQIQNTGKSNMILLTRLKIAIFRFNSTLKMKIFKQPGPAFWCTQRKISKTMPSCYQWDSQVKHWHLLCPQIKHRHTIQLAQAKDDLPNGKARFVTRSCNFWHHCGSCSVLEQGLEALRAQALVQRAALALPFPHPGETRDTWKFLGVSQPISDTTHPQQH